MVGENNNQEGPVFIDYGKVKSMLVQYDENQKKHLKKGLGFEDTRVSFFTIDQLEVYIEKIKKLAKEKNIDVTGVSFITGAYPLGYENEKYRGYQTLIYVPRAVVNGENVLIDLEHSTSGNIVTFKQMLEKEGYFWMYDCKEDYEKGNLDGTIITIGRGRSFGDGDRRGTTANHGQLCPPY